MSTQKPSDSEEEYFARQELERRKKGEKERREKMADEERVSLKELHYMRCPKCGMELTHIELRGIEIDRCVTCNGTWFDEGEVEQFIKNDPGLIDRLMSIFRDS